MNRRSLVLSSLLLVALALPLSASQFVPVDFDKLARNATVVVRATVGPVTSSWDDAHETIFSTANLTVTRYLAGKGPEVLRIREVGGTVGNYTQEAIGFPVLREGQQVVLFLTRWDDNGDWRIDGFNAGKYIVTGLRDGAEMVSQDPVTQGHAREPKEGLRQNADAVGSGMTIDELEMMIYDARLAITPERQQ